uniref:Mitochondrial chaperone BCS1 n=1 Tax=Lygus hesperus TaxID=30085 RepID=A0A0A9XI85_LYGHE
MVDLTSGTPWETVKLTLLGRNSQVFTELLKESRILAASKQEGKIQLYMPMMVDWRPFGRPRRKRPINSVILDQDLNERILKDVKEFLETGRWYSQRGMYRTHGNTIFTLYDEYICVYIAFIS